MTNTQKNQPIHTIRDGNIKLVIWKNTGEHGDYYSYDISRSYKNSQGEYQDTRSLGERDILRIGPLTLLAYTKTLALRAQEESAAD